jgi:hypothetical protein
MPGIVRNVIRFGRDIDKVVLRMDTEFFLTHVDTG